LQTPPNDKLQRFIGKIRDLPTLPQTVLRITELINDPRSSARELAGVISEDQVLTARLLRLVNSAFYGFPQRVTTVTSAVVLLGFDAIRNLLLSTSVLDLFSPKNQAHRCFFESLWAHCLACAVSAKVIGSHLRHDQTEELFVAGLLHDIGKIVELMYLGEDFARVIAAAGSHGQAFGEAERQIIGCDHASTGQLLARYWNLPMKLIQLIGFHHQPLAAGQWVQEAAVVHLADIFAHGLSPNGSGARGLPPAVKGLWKALPLDAAAIEPLMRSAFGQYEAMRQSIGSVNEKRQ
jgi:HD-like signal output (HDOD) protein